jgi:hypothetical protein
MADNNAISHGRRTMENLAGSSRSQSISHSAHRFPGMHNMAVITMGWAECPHRQTAAFHLIGLT